MASLRGDADRDRARLACRAHLGRILASAGIENASTEAEHLVALFGCLPQVLAAQPAEIARVSGDARISAAIADFREAMAHALRMTLDERPVLANSRSLHDYLLFTMRGRTAEMARVLYLTGHNHLIRDEVLSLGTLDQAPIYAREIVHRALDLGAANLILAHNHPSGDREPSQSDVRLTKRLIAISTGLDLCVLDHVVVGRDGVTSMRAAGLL